MEDPKLETQWLRFRSFFPSCMVMEMLVAPKSAVNFFPLKTQWLLGHLRVVPLLHVLW